MLSFLPSDILNAARFGVIQLSACYTASFSTPSDANGGPFTMTLRISDGDGGLGRITVNEPVASYCDGGTGSSGDPNRDGLIAVAANCNPTSRWLTQSTDTTASGNGYINEEAVDSDLTQGAGQPPDACLPGHHLRAAWRADHRRRLRRDERA